jgi:putative ABC transport system permease protein
MFLLKLAIKNLLRSKRRAVLSSAAVVLGIFYLVIGQAFISGVEEGMVTAAEEGLTAQMHLRIDGYPPLSGSYPIDELIEITPEARALLDAEAVAWTERTIFSATAIAHGDSLRLRGIGYDPARDGAVFSRRDWRPDGPVPEGAADGVMLAPGVAKLLNVKKGDPIVLQARTHAGAINALSVPIASILATNNLALDKGTVWLPKELTTELLRTELPSHVLLDMDDREDVFAFGPQLIAAQNGTVETVTWFDETEELLRLQKMRRKALNFLVFMLLLMSSLAIANTILMAAHERTREVGTLRALGMTKSTILRLFLIEGGLIGLVSGAIGAAMGGYGAWYLSENPLDLVKLGSADAMGDGLQFSAYLYAAWDPTMLIAPVIISVAVAVVASVYPARVASNLVVADAVRAA